MAKAKKQPTPPPQPRVGQIVRDPLSGVWLIGRYHELPLRFYGDQLAAASSRADGVGVPGPRWTELYLWATRTGKWVGANLGRSEAPGEVTLIETMQCPVGHLGDLLAFFGNGPLARLLYQRAGVQAVEDV